MKRVVLLVALVAALAGCTSSSEPAADPTPASTSPATPPVRVPAEPLPTTSQAPVQGLDVQYLDDHGHVRTLRVNDFPR